MVYDNLHFNLAKAIHFIIVLTMELDAAEVWRTELAEEFNRVV